MNEPVMTLRFLGTAAAESYPAPFCTCRNCRIARRNGGRDIRRRSALLINDDLLIDFGPDVFQAFQEYGLEATNLHTLLITHGHSDHLAPDNFAYRSPGFRKYTAIASMDVYGPADALDQILRATGPFLEQASLRLLPIRGGDEVESNGYTVRPLEAVHGGERMECVTYLVERGGQRFLYGTDTGPFPESAWDILGQYPPDLAILDSTMGNLSADSHMGFEQVKATVKRLRQLGRSEMPAIAHHFSHHANPSHDELVRIYADDRIGVSFDGMLVDLPAFTHP